MQLLSSIWKMIRPTNLLIVAISQILIYLVYMQPLLGDAELVLGGRLWWLFVLDTVLIAAAGYVINDVFDGAADRHNKPDRIFIDGIGLSHRAALCYYLALVLVGFLIATFIAIEIDELPLLCIYPIATLLLFLYSAAFKKLPLIGNLIVAIFCVFVPGIVLFAEWDKVVTLSNSKYQILISVFIAYMSFAFLSTMVREIVKDIEDLSGDEMAAYRTLPVVAGANFSRWTAFFFCLLLLASYSLWIWPLPHAARAGAAWMVSILLLIPSLYVSVRVLLARTKSDYTHISKSLKIVMILSLIVFLCIPIFIKIA